MATPQPTAQPSSNNVIKIVVIVVVAIVLLCLVLPCCIIAALNILGPAIGNVFSHVSNGLTTP